MEKKILIVGPGAIGGSIAVILKAKKYEPHVIVKYPEQKMIAKSEGFSLVGHHGKLNEKITAFLPSDLINEKYDIVLLATKATELKASAELILPHLNADSIVVSLQNGICEDDLAEIVGGNRTVGCVTGWGATMLRTGEYDMTSGGEFVIGRLDGTKDESLEILKSVLQHIVPVRISENIYGDLYSKLIINSCISTLGGICGALFGEMLSNEKARTIFINIIREAIDVSNAMGIRVEVFGGKLDFYKFLRGNSYFAKLRRQIVIRVIGMKYRRLKSSTLQSIERGKKTEIEWFNGYIVRQADKFGINVSLNKQLVELIREIESGKRKTGFHNFEEIILPAYR